MSEKLEVREMIVTPKIAEELLGISQGANFRKPLQTVIDRYARDMANGNFDCVADNIVLDTEGRVINGLQRLSAIIKSQTTQRFICVSGATDNGQMDTGSKRSMSQYFTHDGVKNAASKSSYCMAIWKYGDFCCKAGSPSVDECRGILERYEEFFHELPFTKMAIRFTCSSRAGIFRARMLQHEKRTPKGRYAEFLQNISDASFTRYTPEWALNSRIISSKGLIGGQRSVEEFLLGFRAAWLAIKGEECKILRVTIPADFKALTR